MNRRLVLLVLLFISASPDLYAQRSKLSIGDRVRIHAATLSPKPTVGHVDALHADALVFVTVEQGVRSWHRLAFTEIDKLEQSQGLSKNIGRSAARGASRGAAIGAVAGVSLIVLGTLGNLTADDPGAGGTLQVLTLIVGLQYAVLGVVAGTAAGALYGVFSKTERWKTISLDLSLNLRPDGLTLTIPIGR